MRQIKFNFKKYLRGLNFTWNNYSLLFFVIFSLSGHIRNLRFKIRRYSVYLEFERNLDSALYHDK